jgi:hypothetical protein
MTKRLAVALGAVSAVLAVGTSGGSGGTSGEPGLIVTVATGIDSAPGDMQRGGSPVAQYFADSGKVVYVSSGLYSSSCPPRGKAAQDGKTINLTVEESGENCTADAGRDTFQIEHVTRGPSRLVIVQAGQPDLRLDLSS